jgi:pimeloyl-ACP methyl ester carboxylesterase
MHDVSAREIRRRVVSMSWSVVLAISLAACGSSSHTSGASKTTASTSGPPPTTAPTVSSGITSVPVAVAHTSDGQVAYRQLGTGTPLLLIMGLGGSIDAWQPSFVDALATRYRVIVFNNAGVGRTSALPSALTPTAMADQTSAFITALGLGRVDVLGWSLGGMVAQALAVQHPTQVDHLILAATQPGTGHAVPIPAAAAADAVSSNPANVLAVLFPSDQAAAEQQYVTGILSYPGYYSAPRAVIPSQSAAVESWLAGSDRSGPQTSAIKAPTLVADGNDDALDPQTNDRMLASTIPGAQLVIYPDAGHAFLFQDSNTFVPRVEQFLRAQR